LVTDGGAAVLSVILMLTAWTRPSSTVTARPFRKSHTTATFVVSLINTVRLGLTGRCQSLNEAARRAHSAIRTLIGLSLRRVLRPLHGE
jgi:hypothetical protein